MVENPPPAPPPPPSFSSSSSSSCSRKSESKITSRGRRKGHQHQHHRGGDESEDTIECTGKNCSSCTASVVADCIAVCCCPCAIANFMILAFVKVPWMMGRKCLVFMKKKKKLLGKKDKNKKKKNKEEEGVVVVEEERRDGEMRKESRVVRENKENLEEDGDDESENFSASYEAERVWLEMYQLGQLGFGRVSISGASDKPD